jgi:hypothetical protein
MGEKRNSYRTLVGNREGKRPLERHKRMYKDNIKKILEEQDGVTLIGLIWRRIGTKGELL